MTDRHLTALELDLLVDGLAGPEATAWRAHLSTCAACAARAETQARLAATMEALPHLAPPPRLAEAVMARVAVEAPGHVALWAEARRFAAMVAPVRGVLLAGTVLGALAITAGVATVVLHPGVRHAAWDVLVTVGNSVRWTVSEGMRAFAPVAVGLGVATLGLGLLAARARRRMG